METFQPQDESMTEGVDFRRYFSLVLHWTWLIVLVGLLAGGSAYYFSKRMTPYYESSTTVLVNAAPGSKASDYTSYLLSEQLTSTYAQMLTTDTVLNQVETDLGLTMPLEDLKDAITVTAVTNTQLIRIYVETTDPELSAGIANSLVSVFADQITQIQSQRFEESKTSLSKQMAEMETQINEFNRQASQATTPEEKATIDTKVTQYREMYASLLQSYEQIRLSEAQSVSDVVQVEAATADPEPVKPKVMQNTLLAALVGMMLALGAIVARDALDDSIKTPDDITRLFKLPVLGVIDHHDIEKGIPISLAQPRSPTAEAFRSIRTNLTFASVDRPLRTLMIASTEAGEGKTTTVTNLGVVLAQSGKRVLIADCDLRHPRVHKYFGLANNQLGVSGLLAQSKVKLDQAIVATNMEGLSILPSGKLPPNPAELLGSQKMHTILEAILKGTDIILVDTPPTLAVTDAGVLAPAMDGVLVVVRPGKTRIRALQHTLDQMRQVNARVIGVLLNNVETRFSSYGYHYRYYRDYSAYQHYYGDKEKKDKKS
jgi:succinoglycan biosynthesis transport protein ExoP